MKLHLDFFTATFKTSVFNLQFQHFSWKHSEEKNIICSNGLFKNTGIELRFWQILQLGLS